MRVAAATKQRHPPVISRASKGMALLVLLSPATGSLTWMGKAPRGTHDVGRQDRQV